MLEARCSRFSAQGALALAVDAGIEAVAAEPFRESAHRVLIEAFLREGNGGDAIRQFERYRDIASELGLVPSQRLVELVGRARGVAGTNGHARAHANGREP
jgi:DNA-binding SARP family transcriptional activator